MYNAEILLDIHARAHESFRRLIVLCGTLTEDELRRPLSGFGFPTVLRQLEHTIGAEVYWQTVVTKGLHGGSHAAGFGRCGGDGGVPATDGIRDPDVSRPRQRRRTQHDAAHDQRSRSNA